MFLCSAGYLGYTSGFSLSCMVFFLSAVSLSGYVRTQVVLEKCVVTSKEVNDHLDILYVCEYIYIYCMNTHTQYVLVYIQYSNNIVE